MVFAGRDQGDGGTGLRRPILLGGTEVSILIISASLWPLLTLRQVKRRVQELLRRPEDERMQRGWRERRSAAGEVYKPF
jgi:hypothetical protein